jgi:UDP-N-acetylglucosamine:LPS N-acetylglucosamine transferase
MSFGTGGHLDETMMIKEAFDRHEIFFVVVKNETTKKLKDMGKIYYIREGPKPIASFKIINSFSLFLYYFYLLFPSLYVFLKERPQLVFGNGGEATLALCYYAKLFGCKVIYLESLARVENLSGTGKLVYKISDVLLVQWKDLLKKYKRAKYWGRVI